MVIAVFLRNLNSDFLHLRKLRFQTFFESRRKGSTAVLSGGEGFLGCLGNGTFEAQIEGFGPIVGLPEENVMKVAAGWAHSAAVTESGALYVWGRPYDFKNVLRLNNMHTASSIMAKLANAFSSKEEVLLVPKLMVESGVRDVTCSAGLTAAVTDNGEVFCFGQNRWGQCGVKSTKNKPAIHVYTPSKVQGLDGIFISKVSLGFQHALALTEEGALYSWGKGERGQLGDGKDENRDNAVRVELGKDAPASQISTGFNHSAAITEEGELYVWGKSLSSELKSQSQVAQVDVYHDQLLPRLVPLPSKASELHCSSFQTTVRLDTGDIWSLGMAHDSRSSLVDPVLVYMNEERKDWTLKGCIHDTILYNGIKMEEGIFTLKLGHQGGEFSPLQKHEACFQSLENLPSAKEYQVYLGWKHALVLVKM
mmetsp:Transcript_19415/g.25584  ORF Transcript_19415/g.25584 Transcript_19415/m.25584 type:complete len:423 (-) Transcript_19415:255-1523(-)